MPGLVYREMTGRPYLREAAGKHDGSHKSAYRRERRGVSPGTLSVLEDEEGIDVLEPARDGSETLEKVYRFQPNVVLMDIDMPEQEGLSAVKTIRKRWPRVKVIVLTFHGEDAFRVWARDVGVVALLSKGADPGEIVRAVRDSCDAAIGVSGGTGHEDRP